MPLPENETRLDEAALAAWLPSSGWSREGEALVKTYRCKGWNAAISFMGRIAVAAEDVRHHPDIHLERYRNVRVVTTTFATGRLSDADVSLARRIDEVYATDETR
ncbi:MAG TPA: 4a-hydroxytetrahydrobiopterin dehydratase [Candidatus Limnocylindrales bacterium]|nr:4a-hydroxytetrahydrobiopterin dehydratase [Candidatus Limnocylindrales bacterium]